MTDLNVGIIGCGNISTAYLELAPLFRGYHITAVADINLAAADAQADAFDVQSLSVEALLADTEIDVVINLTVPAAHAAVSSEILQSGKHVYSEKPYVLSVEEGRELQQLALDHGVRLGSAPDTFLGGAHQAARAAIDSGELGNVIGGSCCVQSHGMESWHPNPDFFFQPGGGPVLDLGPYYVSNLVQLLGPVKRVVAMSSMPFNKRTIGSGDRIGETVPVNVPTSVRAILEFVQGAQVSFTGSWDVWAHEQNHMELYGTDKTIFVPDPNCFGGDVRIHDAENEVAVPMLQALGRPNHDDNGEMIANYRGIGLADMVAGIVQERPHRCSGELSLHVIDILTSIERSAAQQQFVELTTTCERPAALGDKEARSLMNTPD